MNKTEKGNKRGGQQILKAISIDKTEKGNDYSVQIKRKDGIWVCETSHLTDDWKKLSYQFHCTENKKDKRHPCTVCIKKAREHKWWTWKRITVNGREQIVLPKDVKW